MPTENAQATYMLKLLRDFADEPSSAVATEIAGLIDRPGGLGELLGKCFRTMAAHINDKPDQAALDAAADEGRDRGVNDMADAVKAILHDLSTFDPNWIANVVKDARRNAS